MFVSTLQLIRARLLPAVLLIGTSLLGRPPAQAEQPVPARNEPARTDLYGDPLPPGALARLGTVRFRHDGWGVWGLQGLAFLPDSKTLVTASSEGHAIQFREAGSGRRLRALSTGSLWIRGFALAPDGKRLAVSGFGSVEGNQLAGAVLILEAATGKEVRTFPRDSREVDSGSLAFTPDGRLLMSLGENGALRIEEIASGVELLRQQFPRDSSPQLALSPDGSTLAVASSSNTNKLFLWKWEAGEEPREVKISQYAARSLCFSPDGRLLAASSDHDSTIRLWDVQTGRLQRRLVADESMATSGRVAFSPDGRLLATTDYGNRKGSHWSGGIHLWDAAMGKHLRLLPTPGESVSHVAFSPDGRWLAAGSSAGVHVWDLRTGLDVAANDASHRGHLSRVAVSPQGVVATASDDHTVRLWDPATGKHLRKLTHSHWVRALALSPDGGKLASSSLDDTVRLWDLQTGREIYKLAGHGESGGHRALGFAPDGKRFLSWGDDFYLRVWDVATGKARAEHRVRPGGIAFPDGDEADAQEWDLKRQMLALSNRASLFSPDGKALLLGVGQTVHFFDAETGKEVRTLKTDFRNVDSLAVSPDGKLLLASGWGKAIETKLADGRVHHATAKEHPLGLWDLTSGKQLREVTLPGSVSGPVAFSGDGKTYAAATDQADGKVWLWDTATGAERPGPPRFRGRVTALAFSPDDRYLVAGMNDTTAIVWDLTQHR